MNLSVRGERGSQTNKGIRRERLSMHSPGGCEEKMGGNRTQEIKPLKAEVSGVGSYLAFWKFGCLLQHHPTSENSTKTISRFKRDRKKGTRFY